MDFVKLLVSTILDVMYARWLDSRALTNLHTLRVAGKVFGRLCAFYVGRAGLWGKISHKNCPLFTRMPTR